MFGFSIPKLILLTAIILVVLLSYKVLGQRRRQNEVAIRNGKIKWKSRLPEIFWLVALVAVIALGVFWGLREYY